jgi:hypothetical protein
MENEDYSFNSGQTVGVIIKSGGMRLPVSPNLMFKDNIKTVLKEVECQNLD